MMTSSRIAFLAIAIIMMTSPACSSDRQLHVVTTGDVHGHWFSRPYVEGDRENTSLMKVSYYVDSLRNAVGKRNVLLLDAGDCLQGDNAAYYFNYVRPEADMFPRLARAMGYDAIVVGNHDIETGHAVYDRVFKELKAAGIPWLAGNYLRSSDGKPYFPAFKIFRRAGKKVAVLGFGNPNIGEWLDEGLWQGIKPESLIPRVQECVDMVVAEKRPDIVIAVIHSGKGKGNNKVYENQGLDLLASIRDVDLIICGHDHTPVVERNGDTMLLDGGSRAGSVTHAIFPGRHGSGICGEIVPMDGMKTDRNLEERFMPEWEEVRDFTNRKIGRLGMTLRTRDAYRGMSAYVNFIHTVQLSVPGVQLSFAAPLTYDGNVEEGDLIYNDLFTIYPFENQLFVVRMKGREVKDYLEYSYDKWIRTPGEHVLNIMPGADARTGAGNWSFQGRPYNFDSCAGLNYTVDVTKGYGERIAVSSMADGAGFDPEADYLVAMTSYRANGGGKLVEEGAGIDEKEMESRIVMRCPEIREMIYRFIRDNGTVTQEKTGDTGRIGEWRFVPEETVAPLMEQDMSLVFSK